MKEEPLVCPKCKASMRDVKIPEEHRSAFGNKEYFSRVISVYSTALDKTVAFRCPDCGHQWDR